MYHVLRTTPGDVLAVRLQPELSATLPMQGYLLSCALDGSVKVWSPTENPQPNAILETSPNYSHPSTSDSGQVCTIKPSFVLLATAKYVTSCHIANTCIAANNAHYRLYTDQQARVAELASAPAAGHC